MATIFKAGQPNFPANQDELKKRLEKIKTLINNVAGIPTVNIKFIEAAFQLMQDCDLITANNVNFLINPKPQVSIFEGILRLVQDYNDVYDENGHQRFYFGWDRRVELNEQKHFVLSKEWYPWNKQQFYNWLKERAQDACEEYWADAYAQKVDFGKIAKEFAIKKDDNSTAPEETSKPDDLKAVLASLEELHKKFDCVNKQINSINDNLNMIANKLNDKAETLSEDLTKKIEDVNKEVKALYELWK